MHNPKISIIAAQSINHVIGNAGSIPWKIPEDLRKFKETTTGHVIVMGRKTFESIGKPLPNRINIIISRSITNPPPNTMVAHSLGNALELARQKESSEIFVIGGGEIYSQAIKLADRLYITTVGVTLEGDTFFPPYSEFTKTITEEHFISNSFDCEYKILEKQS